MILYHGSNVEVRKPQIIKSKRLLDFGMGFYLTSDYEQAKKWAFRTANRREKGNPVISLFDVDMLEMGKLNMRTFVAADKEWLNYVALNRTDTSVKNDYDVVFGPVANDQAIRTVNDYLEGRFSEDIAIQLLLPQKLKDQYAFKTENSLAVLRFKEVSTI